MRRFSTTRIYLLQAEIFDVDVAPEPSIEQQVPARVMIVVVDIHAVAVPCPIAAAVQVVVGDHPIRIVIEHHAACPVIDAPGNEYFSHVFVASSRIGAAWLEAVVVGIPIGVGVVWIVPALVFAIVVPVVVTIFVLVAAFMLPIVVAVVAI